MDDIKRILENQKEVQYLTYFVCQDDKTGFVEAELATLHISKQYKFRNSDGLLNNIVDILFELKNLEKWALKKVKEK